MSRDSIVIIGGGIAGATTAYSLTRKGIKDIIIIEREKIAGVHSSGLNAAILRSFIPNPLINKLACESAEFYRNPPEDFASEQLVDQVGVYLAASAQHAQTLQKWCDDNPNSGLQQSDAAPVCEQIPLLASGLTAVAYKPNDGVLDIHAILQGFLRGAIKSGAEIRYGREFKSLQTKNGRVIGVETDEGFIEAAKVVAANGAWASNASSFGGYSLPFTPHRRHLLVTEPIPQVNPRWPVVWIVGEEFYFRPESGGLLMCGCDTVKVTPEQGETTDHEQLEMISTKAARWLPSLGEARIGRAWAGMRTFVPDELFVIGADPRIQGLYWVAGLGGHGITTAPIVGRIAADWIVEGKSNHPAAEILSPGRLV